MNLWSGRFKKTLDGEVNDFNSSFPFDWRMYRQDIEGSMAHARMLGECGVIERDESEKIIAELKNILDQLESGEQIFEGAPEDIHMAVETLLTQRLGQTGKRLHTARSRNDQVTLDLRLYLRAEIGEIRRLLLARLAVLSQKAAAHTGTVMPGYTHLQRAQPITFAHHLLAYAFMFMRDIGRLDDCAGRMNVSPLGAGALAGTTYPIDRARTADLLGFDGITDNSLDSVSDRDFALELLSALSILMMHLSRFSEEVILWSSGEFDFITLDDAYSTGSSIMPQKKNPDIAELTRGKTGLVYGDLMALLTVMKGLPLAYNKDMQEDKEAVFDAVDTVKLCLKVFAPMLDTMTVNTGAMRAAAAGGFAGATDCADYLVKKGIAFRDAYTAVGKLIAYCVDTDKTLETLTVEEYQQAHPAFDMGIFEAAALDACVSGRAVAGGPAKEAVLAQLETLDGFLKENQT